MSASSPPDPLLSESGAEPLAALFEKLFSIKELATLMRKVARTHQRGRDLKDLIAEGETSPARYAGECADWLHRRNWIDQDLFKILVEERQDQEAEIRLAAQRCQTPLEGRLEEKTPREIPEDLVDRYRYPLWVERTTNNVNTLTLMLGLFNQADRPKRHKSCVYIVGAMGSGRSRTAYEYARRHSERYDAMIFIDVGGPTLDAAIEDHGRTDRERVRLGLAGYAVKWALAPAPGSTQGGDQSSTQVHTDLAVNAITSYLSGLGRRCLVILDDATDVLAAAQAIPDNAWLDVIAIGTARAPTSNLYIHLDPLTPEGACGLLLKGYGYEARWETRDEEDALVLADRVGRWPLTLALLARLLQSYNPDELLELLEASAPPRLHQSQVHLLGRETERTQQAMLLSGGDLSMGVQAIWTGIVALVEMLIKRVGIADHPGSDGAALRILRVLAWLAPEHPVPLNVLARLCDQLSGIALEGASPIRRKHLGDGLVGLAHSGIIESGVRRAPIVHPLIQLAVRDVLSRETDMQVVQDARTVVHALASGIQEQSEPSLGDVGRADPAGSIFPHLVSAAWALGKEELQSVRGETELHLVVHVLARLKADGLLATAATLSEGLFGDPAVDRSAWAAEGWSPLARAYELAGQVVYLGGRGPRGSVASSWFQRGLDLLDRVAEDARKEGWTTRRDGLCYWLAIARYAESAAQDRARALAAELEALKAAFTSPGVATEGQAFFLARLGYAYDAIASIEPDDSRRVQAAEQARELFLQAIALYDTKRKANPIHRVNLTQRAAWNALHLELLGARDPQRLAGMVRVLAKIDEVYVSEHLASHVARARVLQLLARAEAARGHLDAAILHARQSLRLERAGMNGSTGESEAIALLGFLLVWQALSTPEEQDSQRMLSEATEMLDEVCARPAVTAAERRLRSMAEFDLEVAHSASRLSTTRRLSLRADLEKLGAELGPFSVDVILRHDLLQPFQTRSLSVDRSS